MAAGEDTPDPLATGRGGHEVVEDFTPGDVGLPGFLLPSADVFAIGCVIGHQCTV
jgi:hypothetical protein